MKLDFGRNYLGVLSTTGIDMGRGPVGKTHDSQV